jgi:predicted SAM-dependent methyltransferase
MKPYLNLGCGSRFSPEWTNIDFVSSHSDVIAHDLRLGIPCRSDTFEVVYHSHVLEHFARIEAPGFLIECRRVLKTGGILRIVVPDLESIIKAYLKALDAAAAGKSEWEHIHDYIMLELYDQAVRERPGGGLRDYLERETIPNIDFVLDRGGSEIRTIIEEAKQRRSDVVDKHGSVGFTRRIYRSLRRTRFGREILLKWLLGKEYELLELGRFRKNGEPHLWMYDRYSLSRLLKEIGFREIRVFSPTDSFISDWASYNLDTENDGSVYKPYSLYVEGHK